MKSPPSLAMYYPLINIFILSLSQGQHIQYGFAHRVNTPSNIKYVLDAGANGIEIDVCSDDSYKDWYVSHEDLGYCGCSHCHKLVDWLQELKQYLDDNESKITQLAMLWIDIKTSNDADIHNLPSIVHSAELPENIKILYDFVDLDDNGIYGFHQIVDKLNDTEGVSFFGKNEESVRKIHEFYQEEKFSRGTFNYGSAVGIDEDILSYARRAEFMKSPENPHGFALTLTWTNKKEASIDDHTDPNGRYYTDGQIYGNALGEWSNTESRWNPSDTTYIERFNNIVSNQANTRLATANDDPFKIQ